MGKNEVNRKMGERRKWVFTKNLQEARRHFIFGMPSSGFNLIILSYLRPYSKCLTYNTEVKVLKKNHGPDGVYISWREDRQYNKYTKQLKSILEAKMCSRKINTDEEMNARSEEIRHLFKGF